MSGFFALTGSGNAGAVFLSLVLILLWIPLAAGVTYLVDLIFRFFAEAGQKLTEAGLAKERVHINR